MAYPLFIIWFVESLGDKIFTPYATHRFGQLFYQVDLKQAPWAKHYHGFFLLRRWIYFSMPLWCANAPSLNFIFIILLHTFYTILYGVGMDLPHNTRRLRVTELINEWFFSLLLYESFLMTDLAVNATNNMWTSELQLMAGKAWVYTIGIIIVLNLGIYFYEIATDLVKSIIKMIKNCCKPKERQPHEYKLSEQTDYTKKLNLK